MRQPSRALLALAACAAWASPASAFADDAELLAALRAGGHVGLMRHARAPGMDDPPDFRLGDCSTQRNLSSQGRGQAAAVGERLRAAGIADAEVLSSQWCRCLDTAELLGLGDVEELPALNSLVSNADRSGAMTRSLGEWIFEQDLRRPTILVTHQVNIGALVGSYPAEGEIVVIRPADGRLEVLGVVDGD